MTVPTVHDGVAGSAEAGRSVLGRALAVLDTFSNERPEQTLGAICEATGLPSATTHRLVNELVTWGALERVGRGRYRVGLRLWQLGSLAPSARTLRDVALAFLHDLLEVTHEVVHLVVRDGDKALYLERLMARPEVHVRSRVARRLPLHATGPGKILELLRSNQPRLSMARRLPAGVVGVIAPFNAPIILAIRAIAPALALGNAVVCKPDPRTAVCGGVVFARIFEDAGLPPGLFHMLPGGADVGAAVVDDPLIRVIAFTGSTRAGKIIAAAAAQRLKRVHLELGGNSALIVLDDVDLEKAVSVGAFGSFNHAGQICMATSRHLVSSTIAADYAAALAEHADRIPVGDPTRADVGMGPIIDERQRDTVHRVVTESVDAGAHLRAGGTYEGLFYRPTVLSDVPADRPGVRAGDLRAGRPRRRLLHPRRGRRVGQRHRVRLVAGDPHPRRDEGPRPGRAHPVRARAHQRPDGQRRGADPVRRGRRVGHRLAPRRHPGQPGRVH